MNTPSYNLPLMLPIRSYSNIPKPVHTRPSPANSCGVAAKPVETTAPVWRTLGVKEKSKGWSSVIEIRNRIDRLGLVAVLFNSPRKISRIFADLQDYYIFVGSNLS